jgi:hypothetical protein
MDINSKDASNTIRTTYIESMDKKSKDASNAIRTTYIEAKAKMSTNIRNYHWCCIVNVNDIQQFGMNT